MGKIPKTKRVKKDVKRGDFIVRTAGLKLKAFCRAVGVWEIQS